MNKKQILEIYKNIVDKEDVFLKMLDQIDSAIRFYEPQITDFLSPEMRVIAEDIINFETGIAFKSHGGFEDAERMRLEIFPEYLSPSGSDKVLAAVRIKYAQKFNQLTHRDALGAVLGLGITRQKVGDIVVTDEHIDIVMMPDIQSFIIMSLDKIGRAGVKASPITVSELSKRVIAFQYMNDTVKSLRLDSIVASGYKCSRSEAKQWIESQKVQVNHRMIAQCSHLMKPDDLVSVRGKGRMILKDIEGSTKKDRIRIRIAKY